jgi:hypothetical protein
VVRSCLLIFLRRQSAKAKSRHKTIRPMAAQRPIPALSQLGGRKIEMMG